MVTVAIANKGVLGQESLYSKFTLDKRINDSDVTIMTKS